MREVIAEGHRKLVIDVSGIQYIDSAGIGMLVATAGLMEQHGGQARVAGARDKVSRTFSIVHLDRITAVDPDIETACRRLSTTSTAA
jgi:anti-sigma B factor antagonist